MGTCTHQEAKGKKLIPCKGTALPGSEFCSKHGGKAVVAQTRAAVLQTPANGGATWNVVDHGGMRAWIVGLVDQPQSANVEALVSAMEDGTANGRTKSTPTKAGLLYHASQGSPGKAGALSIFWREQTPGTVQPAAVGKHTDVGYELSSTFSNWSYGGRLTYAQMKKGI